MDEWMVVYFWMDSWLFQTIVNWRWFLLLFPFQWLFKWKGHSMLPRDLSDVTLNLEVRTRIFLVVTVDIVDDSRLQHSSYVNRRKNMFSIKSFTLVLNFSSLNFLSTETIKFGCNNNNNSSSNKNCNSNCNSKIHFTKLRWQRSEDWMRELWKSICNALKLVILKDRSLNWIDR